MNYFRKAYLWAMRYKEIIEVVIVLSASFVTATAYAQISTGIPPISNVSGLHKIICNVFTLLFWILISVSIIMFLWAAYLYVISEGKPEKPSQAKMTILYALFGIGAALIAKGAPLLIASLFGASSSVSGC